MKWVAVTLVLAVLLVVPAADARRESPSARAALKVLRLDPLVVRGGAFKPNELVRVTAATAAGSFLRRVRANQAGTFTVAFREVEVPRRCRTDVTVLARGSRGSHAVARMPSDVCVR